MTETPRTAQPADMERIALNAIRWRAANNNDGKAMAQGDRQWLLAYIDRRAEAAQDAARQRDLLRGVAASGVESDEPILDYVTVQIDRRTWSALFRATEGKQQPCPNHRIEGVSPFCPDCGMTA